MDVFYQIMKRVWIDQRERGKEFDELFLQNGGANDGEVAEAQRPEARKPVILSDFNVDTMMAQEYERNKEKKGREEIMVGNLDDDDDNVSDDDDDEIKYSDNDNKNIYEMSSGSGGSGTSAFIVLYSKVPLYTQH